VPELLFLGYLISGTAFLAQMVCSNDLP